ncbi:MAG: PQQ-binding-like beta-propeller repeat protein [Chloroflexi bacterium]|nr:PQQ-binding-like beta-propeller repeat protein [Chloroflexota bacterium]
MSWSPTENVAWKTPLPGSGWSSPVVWGDRIFLSSRLLQNPPPNALSYLMTGRRDMASLSGRVVM